MLIVIKIKTSLYLRLIAVVLFINISFVYSQEGYVITTKKDTLFGIINFDPKLDSLLSYIDSSRSETTFNISQLLGFRVGHGEWKRFSLHQDTTIIANNPSIIITKDTAGETFHFYQNVVSGNPFQLYRYFDYANERVHYIIQYKDKDPLYLNYCLCKNAEHLTYSEHSPYRLPLFKLAIEANCNYRPTILNSNINQITQLIRILNNDPLAFPKEKQNWKASLLATSAFGLSTVALFDKIEEEDIFYQGVTSNFGIGIEATEESMELVRVRAEAGVQTYNYSPLSFVLLYGGISGSICVPVGITNTLMFGVGTVITTKPLSSIKRIAYTSLFNDFKIFGTTNLKFGILLNQKWELGGIITFSDLERTKEKEFVRTFSLGFGYHFFRIGRRY
jgi:hypothetical protein